MRRFVVALLSTVTALILLFSYHTSTNRSADVAVAVSPAYGSGAAATSTATSPAAPLPSAALPAAALPAAAPLAAAPPAAAPQTFTGGVAQTRWGPVQVEITIESGVITTAAAVQHPTGGESDQINGYAVPILNQSAVSVQSASIETVSGASITSAGYETSLQSALDAAAGAGVTVTG